ncbi:hypothetical protein HG537_0A04590 [Torulaspora globosa]|uniref:C2H2-type domain-containing protein n=1 Tax=Torulaspora globosa TaxID=48254 RepID=A0A7H9HPI1_9SACH|nr:hypothetical protein HG537_0A04590 [Torulaspora sp. CBS 2947]
MDKYPGRQQQQQQGQPEIKVKDDDQQQQQRYHVPLQYKHGYKYPNVVYGGNNPAGNNVCYYVNEQDSSNQLNRQNSGANVVYSNVLPGMYHQGNVFQYPPNMTRTQFQPYQYYPAYPAVSGVPQSRDAGTQRAPQLVLVDNSNTNGMLPSLQIQQPLIQQTAGKHHLSIPFPPYTQAGIEDPRLTYQQPLPLPSVAPTGWINDTNDKETGIKNSIDRADNIDNEDEEIDRKSAKRILDQGSVHKCHLCNKFFKRRSWLKRHLLSHFPDRHFACPWCLSKHKRKDNLLQHMKLKHTDYVLQELRLHNIKVDSGFLTISNNNNDSANSSNSSASTSTTTSTNNSSNNIRSLLYEGKLNKDEVKRVLNSLIDKHNNAHN